MINIRSPRGTTFPRAARKRRGALKTTVYTQGVLGIVLGSVVNTGNNRKLEMNIRGPEGKKFHQNRDSGAQSARKDVERSQSDGDRAGDGR